MIVDNMNSINTSYPTPILQLLQNASKDIKSSGDNKSLLAFLKHHVLKYKKEHENRNNDSKVINSKTESSTTINDDMLKSVNGLINPEEAIESYIKSNSTVDTTIKKLSKGTKDAILGNITKETVGGKKVEIAPVVENATDILKRGEDKLLSANIVLPDGTNVNTHIIDTVRKPGRYLQMQFFIYVLLNFNFCYYIKLFSLTFT